MSFKAFLLLGLLFSLNNTYAIDSLKQVERKPSSVANCGKITEINYDISKKESWINIQDDKGSIMLSYSARNEHMPLYLAAYSSQREICVTSLNIILK